MANSKPAVRRVALSSLVLDDQNANKGTKRGQKMLSQSLEKYGAGRSVLLDRRGRIIAGNKTIEAARAAGMTSISVVETDGKSLIAVKRGDLDLKRDKKARELAIADNRISELDLEWDAETLSKLNVDLTQFWNDAELRKLVGGEALEAPEPQFDKAAELQRKWKTARGQIWQIGKHRLMCGDCTDTDNVRCLTAGITIDAVLTDPPYGTEQIGVPGDDPKIQKNLYDGCFNALPTQNAVIIAFQSPRLFHVWLDTAREHGARFERMLWMYKPPQMGYPWRGWIMLSEAILVFSIGKPKWVETKPYAHDCYTVNIVGKEIKDGGSEKNHGPMWHGSIKPLAVVTDIASRIGHNIYEPFAGSATTFLAAQATDRTCYGMEIEPKYVAVALERLSDMGLKPKLCGNNGKNNGKEKASTARPRTRQSREVAARAVGQS